MDIPAVEGIDVALENHLLQIRIARPERLNAVTPDQMNHISRVCATAEDDPEVRVVVIAGNERAFCSGADLTDTDLSSDGGQIPPVSMGRNVFLPFLELVHKARVDTRTFRNIVQPHRHHYQRHSGVASASDCRHRQGARIDL